MKVLFLEEVPNVASAGDVRDVKNGFARNFLLPQQLAVPATREQLRRVETLKREAALRSENSESRAEALSRELEGLTITIKARTSPAGTLYGSVSAATIAEEIKRATNHDIAAREVAIEGPIKAVGAYETPIRLTAEISTSITVEVLEEEVESKVKPRRRRPRVEAAAPVVAEDEEVAAAAEPSIEEVLTAEDAAVAEQVDEEEAVAEVGAEAGVKQEEPAPVEEPAAEVVQAEEATEEQDRSLSKSLWPRLSKRRRRRRKRRSLSKSCGRGCPSGGGEGRKSLSKSLWPKKRRYKKRPWRLKLKKNRPPPKMRSP